jgi:hypothetical protein
MDKCDDVAIELGKCGWYKLSNLVARKFAIKLCFCPMSMKHERMIVAVTDTINMYIYDRNEDWMKAFNVRARVAYIVYHTFSLAMQSTHCCIG